MLVILASCTSHLALHDVNRCTLQTLKPPEYVQWSVDSKPLNFGVVMSSSGASGSELAGGLQGSSVFPSSGAHGNQYFQPLALKVGMSGHAVTFDAGPPSVSRLVVHSAAASDSGRYTCQPSSGLPASTHVHVALGNE